jgi:hypothetical protein
MPASQRRRLKATKRVTNAGLQPFRINWSSGGSTEVGALGQ